MPQITALQDLLTSIVDKGARLIEPRRGGADRKPLAVLCGELTSTRGEVSGAVLSSRILARYRKLDPMERRAFFFDLADKFDPSPERVCAAASRYAKEGSPEALAELMAASEPPRQEILRRLNLAPGGTAALVALRRDLLETLREAPTLKRIDLDLEHLFGSWFNRGFLMLQRIDWSTPAKVLEKIIEYEAVHEILDWDELRRRLRPADRRCFGFFHPSMPDEPLIFVEVALTREVPAAIDKLLREDRKELAAEAATTAVFYSISNCQPGLRGVSFGNFLIKQVAQDLARDLPNLKTFVTLSPVPGYMRWLRHQAQARASAGAVEAVKIADTPAWPANTDAVARLEELLPPLVASYLLHAKKPDGRPLDPVARFHLGNGATLKRVNVHADLSPSGLAASAGVMVNYLYDLARVEENHEAYASRREVRASRAVRNLAPTVERKPKPKQMEDE